MRRPARRAYQTPPGCRGGHHRSWRTSHEGKKTARRRRNTFAQRHQLPQATATRPTHPSRKRKTPRRQFQRAERPRWPSATPQGSRHPPRKEVHQNSAQQGPRHQLCASSCASPKCAWIAETGNARPSRVLCCDEINQGNRRLPQASHRHVPRRTHACTARRRRSRACPPRSPARPQPRERETSARQPPS